MADNMKHDDGYETCYLWEEVTKAKCINSGLN